MTRGEGERGFTLFELSIVLIIIGLITTMAVQSGVSVIATARQGATQKKMQAIEDALMAFRTANDRLPCPGDLTIIPSAANYGVEGATPGTCTGGTPAANYSHAGATNTGATGVEGGVPTVTLGLPNDFMYDGWGNHIRYAVDNSMTATGAFSGLGLACSPAGAIRVNDMNGNARSTGSIYALISHGANGHGAFTQNGVAYNAGSTSADELTNCHCTSAAVAGTYAPTYVQKSPAYDSGHIGSALYYFDDLVSYKERWQMPTAGDSASCAAQYIYVADTGNHRVQIYNLLGSWIGTIGGTSSTCSNCMCTSGACPASAGSGNGQLDAPVAVSLDTHGNIWVVDQNNLSVVEYSSSGSYLSQIPSSTISSANNNWFPEGIAMDSGNNAWVVGFNAHFVQEYTGTTLTAQIGCTPMGTGCSSSAATGKFNNPGWLTIDGSHNIWVADLRNQRVEEFDSSGTYITSVGSIAHVSGAQGVAVDTVNSFVWIVDNFSTFQLVKYSSAGAYIGSYGNSGVNALGGPTSASIDANENVWVADPGKNRVAEYSSAGSFVAALGGTSSTCANCLCTVGTCPSTSGSGNGQLKAPQGIAIGTR